MWWKTVERHMKQREEAVFKVARKSIGGSFIFHQSTNLFILYWFYMICQWLFNLTQQFCIEEGLWETNYFPFVGRVLNHDCEVMTKQNKWHWIQNHVVIHLLLNDNSMHAKKKRIAFLRHKQAYWYNFYDSQSHFFATGHYILKRFHTDTVDTQGRK